MNILPPSHPILESEESDRLDPLWYDYLSGLPLAGVATEYTVTNPSPARTLDTGTATAADVANVLATLLDDLKQRGILK